MLAERVKKWTHEWKEKGMQKRKAGILFRLMRLKFGGLDAEIITVIQPADAEQLIIESERIFSAKAVKEIFQL